MKKFKVTKLAVLMLFLCAALLCMKPVGVQASTLQKTINTKRPCKSYDITGDKKKDSIQTKWVSDKYISVIVNGKTVYKKSTYIEYDPTVLYCRFENGTPFLFVRCDGVNDLAHAFIFYYKNGKPKYVNLDFGKYGWLYGADNPQVSGNTFSVQYSTMLGATGFTYMPPCTFVYKNGDIRRKGGYIYEVSSIGNYSIGKTSYARTAKQLTAYKDTATKTKAFSLKKGTKVKITKIYYNRKKILVGVEYKGKFGWIKGGTNPEIRLNPLFTNLAFGG